MASLVLARRHRPGRTGRDKSHSRRPTRQSQPRVSIAPRTSAMIPVKSFFEMSDHTSPAKNKCQEKRFFEATNGTSRRCKRPRVQVVFSSTLAQVVLVIITAYPSSEYR